MSKKSVLQENFERLDEGLLTSEFTMGFELECYVGSDTPIYDYVMDGHYYYEEDDEDSEVMDTIASYFTSLLSKDADKKQLIGDGGAHIDSSVNSKNDSTDISVEYSSPIIPCTPLWFDKIIKMLTYLFSNGVYTNSDCGFHHHLHFKGMTERDMIWLYCNLCSDKNITQNFKRFHYDLSDDSYANYDDIYEIREELQNKNFEAVLELLNTKKWRVFRIHPQGTLEWRGPRGFLDDGTTYISSFYKTIFIPLINNIKKYMDSKVIIGTNITKDELFNGLTNAVKTSNVIPNLEFLSHSETYDSSKKLNYKSRVGNINTESVQKFMTYIKKNPLVLYNLVMSNNSKIGLMLNKIIEDDSYTFQNILQRLDSLSSEKNKMSDFTRILLHRTRENESITIKLLLRAGYGKYMTFDIIDASFQEADGIHNILNKIELFKEYDIPINIKSIEKAYVKNIRESMMFSYDMFYMWVINNQRNLLPTSVIAKILFFLTKYSIKNGMEVYIPNNAHVDEIKNVIIQANLITQWNDIIMHGIQFESDFYMLYVGEKDVKTLFNMIKRNPTVAKNLSNEDKQLLDANEIYI